MGFMVTQSEAFAHSPGVLVYEVERFAVFGYGSAKIPAKVEGQEEIMIRKAKRIASRQRDSVQNEGMASPLVKVSSFDQHKN